MDDPAIETTKLGKVYSRVIDTVRAAMAGTLDAGQLTAGLAAVTAAGALTQVAAARRFASLVHHD